MRKVFTIVLCLNGLLACQYSTKSTNSNIPIQNDTPPYICKGIYIDCEPLTIKLDSTIEPDTHYCRLLTRYFEMTLLFQDCNPKNLEDSTCLEDFITQNKTLFNRSSFFTVSLCLMLDHYEPEYCGRASNLVPFWHCPNTDVLLRLTDTLLQQGHSIGIVALWERFDEQNLKHFNAYCSRILQTNDLEKIYFTQDLVAIYHNQRRFNERDQYLKHLKDACQTQNDLTIYETMLELIKEPYIDPNENLGYR